MKEMPIHEWLKKEMKKEFPGCLYIKAPAGIYSSRRGISDFIFCVNGRFVAIEVKTEVGKITPIQEQFLKEVEEAGGIAICMYGKDKLTFTHIRSRL